MPPQRPLTPRPNIVLGYPESGTNSGPNPKQKIFHRLSQFRYRGFGGARGGGKTCAGVQEAIKLSALYPGNVGIVGRYYLRDVVDNIVPELMKWIPPELRSVNQADNKITFWNGSIIYYRALEDPDRLLGAELGWAFIDQAEQVSLESIMNLDGCIRLPDSSRISNIKNIGADPEQVGFSPGIPYSMFMSANPAPGWFKEWFIDNASPVELDDLDIRGNKIVVLEKGDKVFIPSLPRDNPHLPKDYEENLRRQHPEAWSRRYLDGDWDVFEGQFFGEFDDHVHWVYMDPFNLPGNPEVPHYRSIDHGTTHPTCALFAAYDRPYIFVYDEYYIEGAPVYQNVEMIKGKYPDRVFWGTWIDHRTNAKDQSGLTGLHSIRSQYVDGGILCELAYQDVPGGLNRLKELLRVDPELVNPFTGKMGSPRLFIANRCTNLRRSIMAAQYDTRSWYRAEHKEDRIRRIDIDPVDALRYLTTGILMNPIKRYEASWGIS